MSTHTTARATDVDKAVGRAVRARRTVAGMSQKELADEIGVTYQQMHKYEIGLNRMSVSRLHSIAIALGVPVAAFFDELDKPAGPANDGERLCLEAARNLRLIPNHALRTALAGAIRVAAQE
jgi:transcriptional regulator with XRE-family HTH domain